jgi:hypothetical protein
MSEPVCRTLEDGTQEWFLNGKRHRTDGPAWIAADGTQAWYIDGHLHRTDGPAVSRADGTQAWYQHDQLHRTDGPAIVYPSGHQLWFIEGRQWTEQEVELLRFRRWAVEGELT